MNKLEYREKFNQTPPLVKKIRTPQGKYLYDALTNKILLVEPGLFDFFLDGDGGMSRPVRGFGEAGDEIQNEIFEAYELLGVFDPSYPQIVTFSETEINNSIELLRRAGPGLLSLNVTERCNLRCKYCAYSGAYSLQRSHSHRSMRLETALKAVDWYLRFPRAGYSFAFYGGEPFLTLDSIKKVIRYIRSKTSLPVSFNLTTNCTQLNNDTIAYCKNQDIALTISLDGPKAIHDRYRVSLQKKGTFDTIWDTVTRIHDDYPDYYQNRVNFNMVMAPPFDLPAIRAFIAGNQVIFNDGKILISAVGDEPRHNLKEALGLEQCPGEQYIKQMKDLINAYKKDLIKKGESDPFLQALIGQSLISIHQRDNSKIVDSSPSHGQCIPGERKCFVDTDGSLYMCERVQNNSIGSVETGFDEERIAAFMQTYSDFFTVRCHGCWAIRLCSKCYNEVREGENFSEDCFKNFCDESRHFVAEQITLYCTIREANEKAFQWADQIQLS